VIRPRTVPPAPPAPEWWRPGAALPPPPASFLPPGSPFGAPPHAAPHGGHGAGLTPMMDFFQRRVEALEKDLAMERERALTAQNMLSQQDALRSEVDGHLKSLTDQLRREKAERDGEEAKSRSQGRVDALEKRLDEMHHTFAELLKDAVAKRDALPGQALESLGAELAVFRRTVKDVSEQVMRWRDEMKDLPQVLPRVEELSRRIPQDEERFEASIARRLDQFATRMAETLSEWERRQELELQKQQERMLELTRERAETTRLFERQAHEITREQERGREAREKEVAAAISLLADKLDGVQADGRAKSAEGAALRESLERVTRALLERPHAKDQIIVGLEEEKEDLRRALRERHDALRRYSEERRAVEKSLGDGLVAAHGQLDAERERALAAESKLSENRGLLVELQARAAELARALAERDARLESVGAERDQLVRSLVAESEKVRAGLASRAEAEERWNAKVRELQGRLDAETARRQDESGALSDLRLKLSAVTEQMARALQERDAMVARFSDWDSDRKRLLDALRQKDEMVSMLSSAFNASLGGPQKPAA
jgi:chromosome segregation ATPase